MPDEGSCGGAQNRKEPILLGPGFVTPTGSPVIARGGAQRNPWYAGNPGPVAPTGRPKARSPRWGYGRFSAGVPGVSLAFGSLHPWLLPDAPLGRQNPVETARACLLRPVLANPASGTPQRASRGRGPLPPG